MSILDTCREMNNNNYNKELDFMLLSADRSDKNAIRDLISRGADPNVLLYDNTEICIEDLKFALDNGADIFFINDKGKNLLQMALDENPTYQVIQTIQSFMKMEQQPTEENKEATMMLFEAAGDNGYYGFDDNDDLDDYLNNMDDTFENHLALDVKITTHKINAITDAVNKGANIFARNEKGETALELAIKICNGYELIEYIKHIMAQSEKNNQHDTENTENTVMNMINEMMNSIRHLTRENGELKARIEYIEATMAAQKYNPESFRNPLHFKGDRYFGECQIKSSKSVKMSFDDCVTITEDLYEKYPNLKTKVKSKAMVVKPINNEKLGSDHSDIRLIKKFLQNSKDEDVMELQINDKIAISESFGCDIEDEDGQSSNNDAMEMEDYMGIDEMVESKSEKHSEINPDNPSQETYEKYQRLNERCMLDMAKKQREAWLEDARRSLKAKQEQDNEYDMKVKKATEEVKERAKRIRSSLTIKKCETTYNKDDVKDICDAVFDTSKMRIFKEKKQTVEDELKKTDDDIKKENEIKLEKEVQALRANFRETNTKKKGSPKEKKLTVVEMKKGCRDRGIKGVSAMNKDTLINHIKQVDPKYAKELGLLK